ncbi:hypothetical protein TWF506_000021 [Arthrobotrys conoides]|uniref:Uncharacterized protein n=1 Tax=Arthrobotrys conoides TaxID=74498 RepID=A0AAN8RX85_9PEZI
MTGPRMNSRAHACVKILIFASAFNIQEIYTSPIPSNTSENAYSIANMTYPSSNSSGISISPAVLNITTPIHTRPVNDTSSNIPPSIDEKISCADCKSNSTNPAHQVNGTSSNPMKKDVGPSFFYKNNNMVIQCAPPSKVLDITPRENALNFPYDRWPRWRKEYVYMSRALSDIKRNQRRCRGSCACNEDGSLIPKDLGGGRLSHGCSKQWKADRCIVVFGCYCTAVLVQPPAGDDPASLREYQAALDRIPQTVRNDNQGYYWNMNGLPRLPWDHMTWAPSEMDTLIRGGPRPIPRERPPGPRGHMGFDNPIPFGRYNSGLTYGYVGPNDYESFPELSGRPWIRKREAPGNHGSDPSD